MKYSQQHEIYLNSKVCLHNNAKHKGQVPNLTNKNTFIIVRPFLHPDL